MPRHRSRCAISSWRPCWRTKPTNRIGPGQRRAARRRVGTRPAGRVAASGRPFLGEATMAHTHKRRPANVGDLADAWRAKRYEPVREAFCGLTAIDAAGLLAELVIYIAESGEAASTAEALELCEDIRRWNQ